MPVFKYLRSIGINSNEEYKALELNLDKVVNRELKNFRVKMYSAPFFRNYRHMSMPEVISACTPENASAYIPFLPKDKIDLNVLRQFLIDNIEKIHYKNSTYASNFRKLAALYDKLRWGW
ncbi:hypothetical protein [Aeromonas sp.]|uniref:hypothetical protein n=1 Tax=Aeromonas sp. TaxID=647 RepID=UPI00257DFBC2|nr:hypothetical protein [Aeromonas sp.]